MNILYCKYIFYFHTHTIPLGKDSDSGKDSGQEEKGKTEDEMVG